VPGQQQFHTQLRSNIVVETDTETRGHGDTEKMNVLRMNATWYEQEDLPGDRSDLTGLFLG